jgi:hypothetical protein
MINIIETNIQPLRALTERVYTNRCIVHHMSHVSFNVYDADKCHKEEKGMVMVAYHFVITDGIIYRGRPIDTIGAHALGSNFDSIGIVSTGNFEIETPSPKQLKALTELMNYLDNYYNKTLLRQFHKDVCDTTCPGRNMLRSSLERIDPYLLNLLKLKELNILKDGDYWYNKTNAEFIDTLFENYYKVTGTSITDITTSDKYWLDLIVSKRGFNKTYLILIVQKMIDNLD